MTASEIAETLINGNISAARWNLLHDDEASVDADVERGVREAAILALDVAYELHLLNVHDGADEATAWPLAYERVRRLLAQ